MAGAGLFEGLVTVAALWGVGIDFTLVASILLYRPSRKAGSPELGRSSRPAPCYIT